jgi:hypothetical protein
VARLFGRGGDGGEAEQSDEGVLARLDQTALAVDQARDEDADRVRERQEWAWQTRFEDWLTTLEPDERERAAAQLRRLADEISTRAAAGQGTGGGISAGRDVRVDRSSVLVAGSVSGGVTLGNPQQPGRKES